MATAAAQKRSVFPPLLKPYTQPSPEENESHQEPVFRKTPVGPSREDELRSKVAPQSRGAARWDTLRSRYAHAQKSKNQIQTTKRLHLGIDDRDSEKKKKKDEKNELLVRQWDATQLKLKEDKHSELLKRLELQHMLITKNDILARKLQSIEEEKQAKQISSQKTARNELIKELRAHNRRVREHRTKVSETVGSCDGVPAMIKVESQGSHSLRVLSEESLCKEMEQLDVVDSGQQNGHYACDQHTSRLWRILGYDPLQGATPTPSAESAWNILQQETEYKMLPLIEQSYYLRQFANPREKMVLDYFDQPVFEGKSGQLVPLSHVLEEAEKTTVGNKFGVTKAVYNKAKRNQMWSENLLQRKDKQMGGVPQKEPLCYAPDCDVTSEERRTKQLQSRARASDNSQENHVQHILTSPHMKRSLPKYLKLDYSLVSGSLEEVGEKTYCRPSVTRTSKVMHTQAREIQSEDLGRTTKQTLRTNARSSKWLPLSCSALTEYESTCVVPVKVQSSGHLAHGRYPMWKPVTSYTQ